MDEPRVGRELDTEIAEKVMGKTLNPTHLSWTVREDINGSPFDVVYALPHYSTNIADAWQVVEHLNAQGYNIDINNDVGTGKWWCRLSQDNIGYNRSGNTAPHAICRAALMVIETERKEA